MHKLIFTIFLGLGLPGVLFSADLSDLTYVIEGDTVTITDCNEAATGELVIPAVIDGKQVTSIGDEAISYCQSLTSISIPDSITLLGNDAFSHCISLTGIDIPNSVTALGERVFFGCSSLKRIHIPDSVTSVGANSFIGCTSLSEVTLGNGLTTLESHTFEYCIGLTSVSIGSSLSTIGFNAFFGCSSLTEFEVHSDNVHLSVLDGVLFNEDLTKLVVYPAGKVESTYDIPDGVTTIALNAFSQCNNLTTINIPSSLIAFDGIPFNVCVNLSVINVASDNERFASQQGALFNKDKTNLIQYPIGKEETNYTIPGSVVSINPYAFYASKKLLTVVIPDTVLSIGEGAFYFCENLVDVSIGNGVTTISANAFSLCFNLERVSFGSSIISIEERAFQLCRNLSEVRLPDGLTTIGARAFYHCAGLSNVTFSNKLMSIGSDAFSFCDNLKSVTFEGDAPTNVGSFPFGSSYLKLTIYFYEGKSGFSPGRWQGYRSVMLLDFDHDNWPDVLEVALGTDPNDASSQFRVWLTTEAGATHIHYGPHSDACTFVVECTEDLNDPDSWEPVAGLGFTGGLTEQVADLGAVSGAPKFYRVQVSYTAE
ncbi:leucine-rich repeat domain-containing protein [Cerasicoccus fimbriatus]|uniref:leucine-rich repeat domain-containing protein n=1 Tax=Cerasicoccus fimbriatus TaxID=3014554 RepID=UPI0022B33150|nr:leucine-rich repeat domain-containing protein [Cerasicoccus sp. TK19100]